MPGAARIGLDAIFGLRQRIYTPLGVAPPGAFAGSRQK